MDCYEVLIWLGRRVREVGYREVGRALEEVLAQANRHKMGLAIIIMKHATIGCLVCYLDIFLDLDTTHLWRVGWYMFKPVYLYLNDLWLKEHETRMELG